MPTDKTIKHVLGSSELTCLLPLKAGIIPNILDTHTYAARAVIGLRLLHTLRLQSREVQRVRPIVDAVDAIRSIYAFSFSIVDNKILLSVTFDKPWEPYIRIIWRDLGPVLDLVLCNCEGYDQPALEQGYDRFVAWILARQVQAEFFFAQGRISVDDQRYLADVERLARDGGASLDLDLATLQVKNPVVEAMETAATHPGDAVQQYSALLLALHGLRDMYEGDDAKFLASAAVLLMRGVTEAVAPPPSVPPSTSPTPTILDVVERALGAEVAWFKTLQPSGRTTATPRTPPAPAEIQGGILSGYRGMTHGCVLLWRITKPEDMGRFLPAIRVTAADGQNGVDLVSNVAFTTGGLRKLGVPDSDLARFPKEFREGMAARAGLLGDVRGNHPENWPLPAMNWRQGRLVPPTGERVHLSSVDMVITLRARTPGLPDDDADWFSKHTLLNAEVARLAGLPGAELMSVELMRTYRPVKGAQEPFGFRDGISQPCVAPGQRDDVPYGDFVVGHENSRHDPPFVERGKASRLGEWEQGSLIDNGSFLVVRKMRQYVNRLRDVADQAGSRADILSKMVGRTPLGVPLADPSKNPNSTNTVLNDFDYTADGKGLKCPFDSHVRRTNPRTDNPKDLEEPKIPRIARRGMSYGPPTLFDDAPERDSTGTRFEPDRGTMFMAYNASIAEQFEVIQRWITGGNSTGLSSAQVDPLMRVPDAAAGDYTFRYVDGSGTVCRVNLGSDPFVTLEWGLYLFAPSMNALDQLARATRNPARNAQQVAMGAVVIAQLKTEADWAAVMEDLIANRAGIQSAVLAAITALHGGVLRTPYGVIVTTRDLRDQVLLHDDIYSVKAYLPRMQASVGQGFLGLDSTDPSYQLQSSGPNSIVGSVSHDEAFAEARRVTSGLLTAIITAQPMKPARVRLESVLDAALAALCRAWFGVPDGVLVLGGKPANPSAPAAVHLPFHSLAPSRYIFSSPHPRAEVEAKGEALGAALLEAVRTFVAAQRGNPPAQGSLGAQLFASIPSDDLLARTIVGMVEGFLPTVYGNLMKVMNLWLTDETLWTVQHAYRGAGADRAAAELHIMPALGRAMQRRPVPDLLFRTATRATTLGGVQIEPDDVVVSSIVAITEPEEAAGGHDVTPVFGGDRRLPPGVSRPTHACPAINMGLGVMTGFLAAVLDAGEIRTTPSFLVITVEPPPAPVP
ncbi:MAG: hypothetical protein U0Q55_18315 [Vicinamibacterales bacterium]